VNRDREAATDARGRKLAYLLVAATVAAFAARAAASTITPDFPYDDAYIVLHNARSLLAGRDASYAGVSPLYGATSAAHLAAVALLSLVAAPAWASFAVASLGAAAYALGALRLAFAHGWSAPRALPLAALALCLAEVPHQIYNGLETGLALAALTWTLAGYAEAAPSPDAPPTPTRWVLVLTGALPFVRPELAALSLPLCVLVVADRRRARRAVAVDLAWVALGALPWALWYVAETGAPWPRTIAAKRAFFAEECQPWRFRLTRAADGAWAFARMVGVFAGAWLLLGRTRLGRIGAAFSAALVASYFARMPSAFVQYEGRYLYVLLPLMLYGAAAAWRSPSRWVRGLALALIAAGAVQSIPAVARKFRVHRDYGRLRAGEYRAVAGWCRAHLPPGARVLLHDAGFLAERGGLALTDLVGLKSPASVPVNEARVLAACARDHAAATVHIATSSRAAYLLVLVDWNRDYYGFSRALAAAGWRVERRYTSPLSIYEVYALTPP